MSTLPGCAECYARGKADDLFMKKTTINQGTWSHKRARTLQTLTFHSSYLDILSKKSPALVLKVVVSWVQNIVSASDCRVGCGDLTLKMHIVVIYI